MINEKRENRFDCLNGKTRLSEEDIERITELHHEYADMKKLKRYTDKKFRALSESEKKN